MSVGGRLGAKLAEHRASEPFVLELRDAEAPLPRVLERGAHEVALVAVEHDLLAADGVDHVPDANAVSHRMPSSLIFNLQSPSDGYIVYPQMVCNINAIYRAW